MDIPQPQLLASSPSPPPLIAISRGNETETEPLTHHVQPITMRTHSTLASNNNMLNCPHLPQQIAFPYGKCNKNHALGSGSVVLDGCGEFMPSFTSSTSHPTNMICDACGCHRSYHRTDSNHSSPHMHDVSQFPPHNHQLHHPRTSLYLGLVANTSGSPSPPPVSTSYYPQAPHMSLPYNPCLQPYPTNNNPSNFTTASGSNHVGKKRFRTKFSKEQKAKMQEFARSIGWKMQKKDEHLILEFCNEIVVTKKVFKVWMQNHRNFIDRRDNNPNAIDIGGLSS